MAELKRKLTYADLQVTPDDGRRYELARDPLAKAETPADLTTAHARARELLRPERSWRSLRCSNGCCPYGPGRVRSRSAGGREPECHHGTGDRGSSPLVVEILSPSTRRQDRGIKAERYAELGVLHWSASAWKVGATA